MPLFRSAAKALSAVLLILSMTVAVSAQSVGETNKQGTGRAKPAK
jgi:hypothetical protein